MSKLCRSVLSPSLRTMTAICLCAASPAVAQDKEADHAVGRTVAETHSPEWPSEPRPAKGAPNVLVIMTDDVGFGTTSTFGGPVQTQAFEQLASTGVRYNRFNTTALCSPTRASLLTGRMPHNVNMGNVTNLPTGYEGYTTVIPKSGGTVAQILKENGYNTAMFGKSHLTPDWEMSPAGPFDRWPTGLGFEYFYGFLSADTSLWDPNVYENTRPVDVHAERPGYHFEADIADHAIAWLREHDAAAPDKPFFMYYAPGAAHTPHHAPKDWIERYRGKFDKGWDNLREKTFARQKKLGIIPRDAKLTPRPGSLPAWASLDAEHKAVYARLMEAFAATVAYSDAQTGRLIDEIRRSGKFDNTLIIYIEGDNGSSAEGGPSGLAFEQSGITGRQENFEELSKHLDDIGGPNMYNHMPAAWAWATNAPFPWWKQIASQLGGVRNGMVVSWPREIKASSVPRSQYAHVSDIMPTILDAAGVTPPDVLDGVKQQPIDGVSLRYSFTAPSASSQRRTQIYEIMENFGIYHDGWMAGTLPKRAAWDAGAAGNRRLEIGPDQRQWTLFNLEKDYSSAVDLSKSQPAKLKELQDLFWAEAAKNHMLPVHDYSQGTEGRPTLGGNRLRFEFLPGLTRLNEDAAPHTIGRSFTIDSDVVIPASGADGVMISQGGRFGGYAFYLKDGKPAFHYNAVGTDQFSVHSDLVIPEGAHRISAAFVADEAKPGTPGTLTISVDGTAIASGRIGRTVAGWISHVDGLDIGRDTITPVTSDYTVASSIFTGEIDKVTVTLRP